MSSDVLDAEGNFVAGSVLTSAEQTASAKLTSALQQEINFEGEAAAVASAFVGAMIGGEAAVAALAGGASIAAAAAAGTAAAEAAAAEVSAGIASGPAFPVALAVFAVPEVLTAIWPATAGYGCCGPPPNPTPLQQQAGHGIAGALVKQETTQQAAARALAQARAANASSSCSDNPTYEEAIGTYAAPQKGSFQEYAYAFVLGAIAQGELLDCWPIARVDFARLLAFAISSWNATHAGPSSAITIVLGHGAPGIVPDPNNPIAWAMAHAVPPDEPPTHYGDVAKWSGKTYKIVTLHVNVGAPIKTLSSAFPNLAPIKAAAVKAAPNLSKAVSKATSPFVGAAAVAAKRIAGAPKPISAAPSWWTTKQPVLAGATPRSAAIATGSLGLLALAIRVIR